MNWSSYDLTTMNYYCPVYGFRINSFVVDTKHAFFDVIADSTPLKNVKYHGK